MKNPTSIFSILSFVIIFFSCKKDNLTTISSCKTYNISYEGFEKGINYQGCNGTTYASTYNQAAFIEAKEGTLQVFELRYTVAIENNSSILIQYIDAYESNNIDAELNKTIKSTGDFVLKYDEDKVTKQYAEIWKDGEKLETRIFADGSTKFLNPLKSGTINIIKIFNGTPVNN